MRGCCLLVVLLTFASPVFAQRGGRGGGEGPRGGGRVERGGGGSAPTQRGATRGGAGHAHAGNRGAAPNLSRLHSGGRSAQGGPQSGHSRSFTYSHPAQALYGLDHGHRTRHHDHHGHSRGRVHTYRAPALYGGYGFGGVGLSLSIGPRVISPYGYYYSTPSYFGTYGYFPNNPYGYYSYAPYGYPPGSGAVDYLNRVDPALLAPPALSAPAELEPAEPANRPEVIPAPAERAPDQRALERAARALQSGDELFGRQQPHSALQRYKEAARAAGNLATAHYRQGVALVATRRYELAAEAFRRGIAIAPVDDSFRVSDLYADNLQAHEVAVEALVQAVEASPDDAELWFVLGMMLRLDGQPERAMKFLQRADQLSGGEAPHLRSLLDAADRPVPPSEAPDDGRVEA